MYADQHCCSLFQNGFSYHLQTPSVDKSPYLYTPIQNPLQSCLSLGLYIQCDWQFIVFVTSSITCKNWMVFITCTFLPSHAECIGLFILESWERLSNLKLYHEHRYSKHSWMVELFFFLFWLHENCGKTPLQELKESEEGAAFPPATLSPCRMMSRVYQFLPGRDARYSLLLFEWFLCKLFGFCTWFD